jgi:hypothetical protein
VHRNRWLIYILIGLVFGLVDWYFLAFLAAIGQNQTILQAPEFVQLLFIVILMAFNYGVWLIPAIPVAIYETRYSQSLLRAAMSAITVWSMALLSYYSYYAFMLMFVGLPNMNFMLFANHLSPTYWAEWWPPFKRVIVNQLVDWIWIAIAGGAIAGISTAYLTIIISKRRLKRVPL